MKVGGLMLRSCGLAAMALLAATLASANSIPNPNFTIPGAVSVGTVFSTSASTSSSAAADWGTFVPDPNSIASSELLASTDNLSGDAGNMLSFSTNAGFNGSAGNGIFTSGFFIVPAGTTGFMDINVAAGTTGEIGFVVGSAFSAGSYSFSGTSGWQRVSFSTTGATNEFGFEIFSGGGGSMLVADPTAPTPEPSSLLLLGSGLLGFAPFLRRKFARP
jgi:hypothetical protein